MVAMVSPAKTVLTGFFTQLSGVSVQRHEAVAMVNDEQFAKIPEPISKHYAAGRDGFDLGTRADLRQ